MPGNQHPLRGALPLFLAAGFFLSSLDATAKWLMQGETLLVVVWARYAGQMLIATPFARAAAGPSFWRTKRLRLQLLRSLCLLAATFCFFAGLAYLPLAEASAITFLSPVFVALLSGLVLGEHVNRWRLVAAAAGFVGVVVILRPGTAIFHPAAILMGVVALLNALYQMLTRKVADENPYTSLFYTALLGTVGVSLLLPFVPAAAWPSSITAWWLLLLTGLLAGVGHWCLIGAFSRAPAAALTPFSYLAMVWAIGYGRALFGQIPDGITFCGMVIIVGSGVALAVYERNRRRGA